MMLGTTNIKKLSDGTDHHWMSWISTRTKHINEFHLTSSTNYKKVCCPINLDCKICLNHHSTFSEKYGTREHKIRQYLSKPSYISFVSLSSLVFLRPKSSISKSFTSAVTSLYFSTRCGFCSALYRIRAHFILQRNAMQ